MFFHLQGMKSEEKGTEVVTTNSGNGFFYACIPIDQDFNILVKRCSQFFQFNMRSKQSSQ